MTPYRSCSCREASTTTPDGRRVPGKLLGKSCPKLKSDSRHGAWYSKYEAPAKDGKRVQRRVGPCDTERECKQQIAAVVGQLGTKKASDAATRTGDYFSRWLAWKQAELKPSTFASYREAVELYFRPGLGHRKLGDVTESEIKDLYSAMRKISRAEDDSEMLRRLLDARARWHGKRISTRPLTDARIRRLHAVLRAALNDASIPANPASRVSFKIQQVRPKLWSPPRVQRWRETGEVPAAVMVWDAVQAGAFLDAVQEQRLYTLWHLAVFTGMRRNEICQLRWADTDLDSCQVHVTGDIKTENSDRVIVIDPATAEVLRDWQGKQMMERLQWDDAWQDTGHVFTREDGRPVRTGWVTERFATLLSRAGLPPVTFHGLRHGSATMALAAGVPITVISRRLGHASIKITADLYTEVAAELEKSAAAAIAAFVPRKSTVRVINESSGSEDDH